ncbi:MAG: signal peptidase I [Bacillota bacterium]
MSDAARKEVWEWVKTLAVALVLALLIKNFLVEFPLVPTGSMIPTIQLQERIVVDKLTYRFKPVQRGDIVVFPNPDNNAELYVKRAIGLPGETVEIHDGKVFINGEALDEPYLRVVTQGRFGPYKVPEGHYFFLGDNRNSSRDSRFWTATHYIAAKDVKGKAQAIIWPLNKIRALR